MKDKKFKDNPVNGAEERLKEFVGHTPLQVLVGALLGILIGAGTWWLMNQ